MQDEGAAEKGYGAGIVESRIARALPFRSSKGVSWLPWYFLCLTDVMVTEVRGNRPISRQPSKECLASCEAPSHEEKASFFDRTPNTR